MLYYFLPGNGIYGGIKVAYQFVDLLNELGRPTVVAAPEAKSAAWFSSHAPVVNRAAALAALTEKDVALFSLPDDFVELRRTPARLVFHCQGTDPRIDPILEDGRVVHLTCWRQATEYVRRASGRPPIEVGLFVAPPFFYNGQGKQERLVSFMPRRGYELARACGESHPTLRFQAIDGLTEDEVAARLQDSGFYLATAPNEWFGLPALEAMAAACIVLSVETVGGGEYLIDGETCLLCAPGEMPARLGWVLRDEQAELRWKMRQAGLAMAHRYHRARQVRRLRTLLAGPLREVFA